jgi:hypothetical protein
MGEYPWDVDGIAAVVLERTGDEFHSRQVAAGVRSLIGLGSHAPHHLRPGILRYIVDGIEPGRFLRRVLENDLTEAVNRCNGPGGLEELRLLVGLLYNGAPSMCWGTPDKVSAWIEQKGLAGEVG